MFEETRWNVINEWKQKASSTNGSVKATFRIAKIFKLSFGWSTKFGKSPDQRIKETFVL